MILCPECNTKNLNESKECEKCETNFDNEDVLNQLKDLNRKVTSVENTTRENQSVAIHNIDMPFADMVAFMVKWAIAAIPAMLILSLIGVVISMIFSSLFRIF